MNITAQEALPKISVDVVVMKLKSPPSKADDGSNSNPKQHTLSQYRVPLDDEEVTELRLARVLLSNSTCDADLIEIPHICAETGRVFQIKVWNKNEMAITCVCTIDGRRVLLKDDSHLPVYEGKSRVFDGFAKKYERNFDDGTEVKESQEFKFCCAGDMNTNVSGLNLLDSNNPNRGAPDDGDYDHNAGGNSKGGGKRGKRKGNGEGGNSDPVIGNLGEIRLQFWMLTHEEVKVPATRNKTAQSRADDNLGQHLLRNRGNLPAENRNRQLADHESNSLADDQFQLKLAKAKTNSKITSVLEGVKDSDDGEPAKSKTSKGSKSKKLPMLLPSGNLKASKKGGGGGGDFGGGDWHSAPGCEPEMEPGMEDECRMVLHEDEKKTQSAKKVKGKGEKNQKIKEEKETKDLVPVSGKGAKSSKGGSHSGPSSAPLGTVGGNIVTKNTTRRGSDQNDGDNGNTNSTGMRQKAQKGPYLGEFRIRYKSHAELQQYLEDESTNFMLIGGESSELQTKNQRFYASEAAWQKERSADAGGKNANGGGGKSSKRNSDSKGAGKRGKRGERRSYDDDDGDNINATRKAQGSGSNFEFSDSNRGCEGNKSQTERKKSSGLFSKSEIAKKSAPVKPSSGLFTSAAETAPQQMKKPKLDETKKDKNQKSKSIEKKDKDPQKSKYIQEATNRGTPKKPKTTPNVPPAPAPLLLSMDSDEGKNTRKRANLDELNRKLRAKHVLLNDNRTGVNFTEFSFEKDQREGEDHDDDNDHDDDIDRDGNSCIDYNGNSSADCTALKSGARKVVDDVSDDSEDDADLRAAILASQDASLAAAIEKEMRAAGGGRGGFGDAEGSGNDELDHMDDEEDEDLRRALMLSLVDS